MIAQVLFVAFVIYAGVKNKLGFSEMVGFLICVSQVWGLTFCVLLLGM